MTEQQPEAKSRTVLIAIDESKGCEHAFDWLSKTVHKKGDLIICLHIAQTPDASFPYTIATQEYKLNLEKNELKIANLEKKYTQKCLDSHMHAKIKVLGGQPGEKICQYAKDQNVDLIVVGCRGVNVLRRTLMGSVSDYVLHHAHVPVIIVPKK